MKELVNMRQAN